MLVLSLTMSVRAETTTTSAPNSDSSSTNSDTATTYVPRTPTVVVTEANLRNGTIHIDDSNFKTLIHHCLKSHDQTACSGMAHWDVSRVTDCSFLFWEPGNDPNADWTLLRGADVFNIDLSAWDTSSCTTMRSMFHGAEAFDQPIGNWNVQRVTDMSHMQVFQYCCS